MSGENMTAGTITLTNNSDAVAGVGTAFLTELAAGDFIVANVGGIAYTLPVKAITSDTALTIVSKFTGPTMSSLAWFIAKREQQAMITAALVAQSAEALRGLNYDKQNWQAVFSVAGDITVTMPDGTQFTGPSWQKIVTLLEQSDIEGIQQLADQVRADALQVAADKAAATAAANTATTEAGAAANSASSAATAKDAAVSASASAQQAKTDAVAAKVAAEAAAGSIDTSAFLRKDGNLAGLTDKVAARTELGLGTAATANIGGVVSMGEDGRPNGAVFEHGSNANGRYTKFADGTMICWFTGTTAVSVSIASGSLYRSGTQTLTFPAAFISPPTVVPSVKRTGTAEVAWGVFADPTTTNVAVFGYSGASTTVNVGYVATGRWI